MQLPRLVHWAYSMPSAGCAPPDAIEALREGGYRPIRRADQLAPATASYAPSSTASQLPRMRRNHLIPDKDCDLRVLGGPWRRVT